MKGEGSQRDRRGSAAADLQRGPRVEHPQYQLKAIRLVMGLVGRVSPSLGSRLALRLFLTIRRHRRPAREEDWLRAGKRFEVDAPGGRLAAVSWGEGPPVVLSHGWEGRGSQMGAIGLGIAEAGFRAVSYDAPGHGESSGRSSSLLQFADAVRIMVESQGPLAGFVGHSFGGAGACFALWRKMTSPEQLGKLVFVAPPGDLHRFIVFFERLMGLPAKASRGYERALEDLLGVSWDQARHCTSLAATDAPLLVLHDEHDRDTPLEDATAVAGAWPDARQVTTSGLGHRRILRDPGVVRTIAEFLSATE